MEKDKSVKQSHRKSGRSSWIGVDLDGTLAYYTGWKGLDDIGEPIPAMMARVKKVLTKYNVKIFTARACIPDQIESIKKWLVKHGLEGLEITNVKDFGMIELWDDKCVQVELNTGRLLGNSKCIE